ncbi:MAG: PEP-CTERM sorting domain-containing protein [Phycisphaeraceae bacterium]|nr:hypothetical protein [Phycisphaerales bacterium]MCB9858983.1 PEP-CTERM sorting domain-containing protein [Phycisphaeraceae bacterium]
MKHNGFTTIFVLAACTGAVCAQSSFQGIGFLSGAGHRSYPYDISGDGSTVVAYALDTNGAGQPARWTKSGGLESLGEIPGAWSLTANGEALGVNYDGSVITGSSPGALGREVFRWTQATGMVGLGDLNSLSITQAYGRAISDDGAVIVGQGDYSYGLPGPLYGESFRWTESSGLVGLGHLTSPPAQQYGIAMGCSSNGDVVVGWATTPNGTEAYRWTESAGMVGLGDVAGGAVDSGATACSADGNTVVGWVRTELRYEPAYWTESIGWTSLGTGWSAGIDNYAGDCTPDASVIVGALNITYGGVVGAEISGDAFIWDATNGMRNIKDELMLGGVTDVAGWTLLGASGVSHDGKTVAGIGINPQGEYEGWVATLSGDSACYADCDENGSLNIFDYICFGNAFAAGCP